MALKKTFTNSSGFTGDFWLLSDVAVSKSTGTVEVKIACYKDQEAWEAGMTPFIFKSFSFKTSLIDLSKDVYEEVYKVLPTLKSKRGIAAVNEVPFFHEATRVEL